MTINNILQIEQPYIGGKRARSVNSRAGDVQRGRTTKPPSRKDTSFTWGPAQQQAFDSLKHALTSPPVLAYPDYTQPFLLYTDALINPLAHDGAFCVIKAKKPWRLMACFAS